MPFHSKVGSLIVLSADGCTATRDLALQEFNNALVFSHEPLQNDVLFEVRIERKVDTWSGSIEVGVMATDPASLTLPTSASNLTERAWVMSGFSILKDGYPVVEEYGPELDKLQIGDVLGVMRSAEGELHFFVNGTDLGVAAQSLPPKVWAVVDLYGKCCRVTCLDNKVATTNDQMLSLVQAAAAAVSYTGIEAPQLLDCWDRLSLPRRLVRPPSRLPVPVNSASCDEEALCFHTKCGSLIRLSANQRSAERRRPTEEFNNGVVMTNRPLPHNQLFEIRIDQLIDKWSGSIEIGVTTHNPSLLDMPTTMTNLRSGTIIMSGCGILTNGKGTRREYGDVNLDNLVVGDRIGVLVKDTGELHFFINGRDQGVATSACPPNVWGVVDLYGMTVKVSIEQPQDIRRGHSLGALPPPPRLSTFSDDEDATEETEKLVFHHLCGFNVRLSNGARTASRPNATCDFNNGVVITNRTLRPNEIMSVRLDCLVEKWAGSLEIGLSTFSPSLTTALPTTMTGLISGARTWMLTGNGVLFNGTTILNNYRVGGRPRNLATNQTESEYNSVELTSSTLAVSSSNQQRSVENSSLCVGDILGVQRRLNGDLHFYLNGMDMGVAATRLPPAVFGVVDLYGQASRATLIDTCGQINISSFPSRLLAVSPTAAPPLLRESSSCLVDEEELVFHHRHGKNAVLCNNNRTAKRLDSSNDFNDALVMSSRPLRDNELFEVVIEDVARRWSGSLEAGVSLHQPDDEVFPRTITYYSSGTWTLTANSIMKDGITINSHYSINLDDVVAGSRVGIVRRSNGCLHFFLNGQDAGIACSDVPLGVYVVLDLYGQCVQLSLTNSSGTFIDTRFGGSSLLHHPDEDGFTLTALSLYAAACHDIDADGSKIRSPAITPRCGIEAPLFHDFVSESVVLNESMTTATLLYKHGSRSDVGLLFSADPVRPDTLLELRVDSLDKRLLGSLSLGLVDWVVRNGGTLPHRAVQLQRPLWMVDGRTSRVYVRNRDAPTEKQPAITRHGYARCLQRLKVGSRIGLYYSLDGHMSVVVDGVNLGIAASAVPKNCFLVVELDRRVSAVTLVGVKPWKACRGSTVNVDSVLEAAVTRYNAAESHQQEVTLEEIDFSMLDKRETEAAADYRFGSAGLGGNAYLSCGDRVVNRRDGTFCHALAVSNRPLRRLCPFVIRVDTDNHAWDGSLSLGVLLCSASTLDNNRVFVASARDIRVPCLYLHRDAVFNEVGRVGKPLSFTLAQHFAVEDTLTLMLDGEQRLKFYLNGELRVVLAENINTPIYPFVDLYGGCQQVHLLAPSMLDKVEKARTESRENSRHGIVLNDARRLAWPSCSFRDLCKRARSLLAIPEFYLRPKHDQCFCSQCCALTLSCNRLGGDEYDALCGGRGQIDLSAPQPLAIKAANGLPIGWMKFGLRIPLRADARVQVQRWPSAYMPLHVGALRSLLDLGDPVLLFKDPLLSPQQLLSAKECDRLMLSPSFQTVTSEGLFDHQMILYDLENERSLRAEIVIEVRVKPGSYSSSVEDFSMTSSSCADANVDINEHLSEVTVKNEEYAESLHAESDHIHWTTKEHGAVVCTGLLLRATF